MKKRIIVTAAITACLALWGAVWPQAETVGEPPASPQTPAVSAPEPIVAEVKLETEIDFPAEKEISIVSRLQSFKNASLKSEFLLLLNTKSLIFSPSKK